MFQCPNQFSRFVQKIKGQMEAASLLQSSRAHKCLSTGTVCPPRLRGIGRLSGKEQKLGGKQACRERLFLKIPVAS